MNDTLLPDGETSFFETVKFYTDKYIVHRDNTSIDDDEKKIRIKSYFLNNEEFGLVFTVKAIIEIAKDIEQEDINATKPRYSLDQEIDIDRDINHKLINEIRKNIQKILQI